MAVLLLLVTKVETIQPYNLHLYATITAMQKEQSTKELFRQFNIHPLLERTVAYIASEFPPTEQETESGEIIPSCDTLIRVAALASESLRVGDYDEEVIKHNFSDPLTLIYSLFNSGTELPTHALRRLTLEESWYNTYQPEPYNRNYPPDLPLIYDRTNAGVLTLPLHYPSESSSTITISGTEKIFEMHNNTAAMLNNIAPGYKGRLFYYRFLRANNPLSPPDLDPHDGTLTIPHRSDVEIQFLSGLITDIKDRKTSTHAPNPERMVIVIDNLFRLTEIYLKDRWCDVFESLFVDLPAGVHVMGSISPSGLIELSKTEEGRKIQRTLFTSEAPEILLGRTSLKPNKLSRISLPQAVMETAKTLPPHSLLRLKDQQQYWIPRAN